MTSGPGRASRHASARIAGSAWRSNVSTIAGGKREPSRAALLTAWASVGPCTQPLLMIRATACAESGPPIAASASSAAICSGNACVVPKPAKRRQ